MTRSAMRFSLLAAFVLIGCYLSFELGRFQSGFSLLDSRRRADEFSAAIADRDGRIGELERQIAILETSQDIDRETYSTVEGELAALESRIQAQEEELAFYRGIVSPDDGVPGLRIQTVEIGPAGEAGGTHVLRVLLVQAIVHNERVSGSLRATVRGELAGEAVELGLDRLGTDSDATDIPYDFRYFQTIELALTLPEALVPAEVEVQLWPGSPRGEPIVETFPWARVSG